MIKVKSITYLLGLVTQATRLVRASGVSDTDNGGFLAVLPHSDPRNEVHEVRLLLPPYLR